MQVFLSGGHEHIGQIGGLQPGVVAVLSPWFNQARYAITKGSSLLCTAVGVAEAGTFQPNYLMRLVNEITVLVSALTA